MPRSIWSGTIAFGLISVPVKLYSALSPKTVRFHQLHATDHVRIQQKRICPADGAEVPYEDIVKGYEIEPERYVVIEPEDLASVEPAKARTIKIEDFVELAEIDPIYYDHPYYLVPGQGATESYELLLSAMRDAQKVAIARVVMRGTEHLVAVRPMGRLLAMATMNFADEVLSPDLLEELPSEEPETSEREREVAKQLIDTLTVPFAAERYHDTYRQALLELIERKAKGQKITPAPAAAPTLTAPDLMSALKASLEEARARESNGKARKPSKPKQAAPKAKAAPVKSRATAASTKNGARKGPGAKAAATRERAKPKK